MTDTILNPNCPTLRHILNSDQCEENYAGLGSTAYVFNKDDLAKPLEANKEVYTFNSGSFKEGKGFYKVELRENSQSFTGESQGRRKGFKITSNLIVEVVNEATAELLRAMNNLDFGFVLSDGDKWQILYSPNQKVTIDAGGLKTETGAAASDDRITTIAPTLENVKYPNLWVEFKGEGDEDLTPEDMLAD